MALERMICSTGGLKIVCSDSLNETNLIIPLKKEATTMVTLPENDRTIVARAFQLTLAPLIKRDSDINSVDDLKIR
jgi:hypothetical protein